MIFQEPMTSLNPCFTVGFQIGEALKTHLGLGRAARRARSIELLEAVGIPDPERRLAAFPHQLSGGMNQRVMIAMALACRPKLLIADEPTTALDVTIQAQILDLLLDLQNETGMALVLITHDMGVVAETAERVAVFYAGQKVEEQGVRAALRRSAPSLHGGAARGAAGARGRAPAAVDRRRRARPVRPAGGLPVLAALPLRHRALPQRSAAAPGAELGLALCHYPLARRGAARPPRPGGGGGMMRGAGRHRGEGPRPTLCDSRRGPFAEAADGQGGRRRQLHARGRQDAGRRRRIGLRQVDARAPRHHDRAADRRGAGHRRHRRRRRPTGRRSGGCGAKCRSSSRTPTARSIRARRSARCSRSR